MKRLSKQRKRKKEKKGGKKTTHLHSDTLGKSELCPTNLVRTNVIHRVNVIFQFRLCTNLFSKVLVEQQQRKKNDNTIPTMTAKNVLKFAVTVLIITCHLFGTTNGYTKGAAAIDFLRAQYLQLEAELWSIIENGVDQSSVLNQILGQHKAFIDSNITANDYNENEFYLFEKIYEWSIVKESLVPIRSLFDSFRTVIDKNHGHFNSLELNDLADTILSEWELINGTATNIDTFMVKQGTYYKVMLVRNVQLAQNMCKEIF